MRGRPPNVVPFRRARRRRAPHLPPRRGRRLLYLLVWTAIGAGAAALAPVVDDLRSSLRETQAGCRVIRVIDGDSVEIGCPEDVRPGPSFSARIVGFDAPESFSPRCPEEYAAALEAQAALTRMLRKGDAMVGQTRGPEIAFLGADKYGRMLVDMRVGGTRVATEMVRQGHGRRYLGGLRGGWC